MDIFLSCNCPIRKKTTKNSHNLTWFEAVTRLLAWWHRPTFYRERRQRPNRPHLGIYIIRKMDPRSRNQPMLIYIFHTCHAMPCHVRCVIVCWVLPKLHFMHHLSTDVFLHGKSEWVQLLMLCAAWYAWHFINFNAHQHCHSLLLSLALLVVAIFNTIIIRYSEYFPQQPIKCATFYLPWQRITTQETEREREQKTYVAIFYILNQPRISIKWAAQCDLIWFNYLIQL